MLLAEADRDTYRREQANVQREKEIMKDVPGWEVSTVSRDPLPLGHCDAFTLQLCTVEDGLGLVVVAAVRGPERPTKPRDSRNSQS